MLGRRVLVFEGFGFLVLASSLSLGLEALKRKGYPPDMFFDKRVQAKRLGLATTANTWQRQGDRPFGEPLVVQTPLNAAVYPFATEGDYFEAGFVTKLNQAFDDAKPVFVHTGATAKVDYIFFFPHKAANAGDNGAVREWSVHVGDAKQDSASRPGNISTRNQEQVREGLKAVQNALENADMHIINSNMFIFSTSDRLAAKGKNGLVAEDIQVLSPASFEFAPFTDILFALACAVQDKAM